MKLPARLLVISVVLFLMLAVIFGGAVLILYRFQQGGRIAQGVRVDGIELTGLTPVQANDRLQKQIKRKTNRNAVLLSYEKKTWQIDPVHIDLAASAETALAEAYGVGRSGDIFRDLKDTLDAISNGKEIAMPTTLNREKLREILNGIAKTLEQPNADAYIYLTDNGLMVKKGALVGRKLDTQALADKLIPDLIEMKLSRRIELEPVSAQPKITDEDLKPVDRILADFSMNFDPTTPRGNNIALAAAALDRTLLRPGEELSLNKVLGDCSNERGYQDALVANNSHSEVETGGGLCQLATCLMNAALLSDLSVTERHAHKEPPIFASPGLEACIYDKADLKIKNTLKHNIYILTSAANGELVVNILGASGDLGNIDIGVYPSTTSNGHTQIWRVYYEKNKEFRRTHLYTETYGKPGNVVPPSAPPQPKPKPKDPRFPLPKNPRPMNNVNLQ